MMTTRLYRSIPAAVCSLAVLLASAVAPAVAQTVPAVPATPYDLTANGIVNIADAEVVASAWGSVQGDGACTLNDASNRFDLNGNGCVNVADVQNVLAQWGSPATEADAQRLAAPVTQQDAGAIFTVNTKVDGSDARPGDGICEMTAGMGNCSLKAAVQESNKSMGRDTIAFNVRNPDGTCPIGVTSFTPAVSQVGLFDGVPFYTALWLDDVSGLGTVINGYTQCGASENTEPITGNAVFKIELKAANSGRAYNFGLYITSQKNEVRGLSVYNWADNIRLDGSGAKENIIAGNIIGTNAAQNVKGGGSSISNSDNGLRLRNRANNNLIGGFTPRDRNIVAGSDGDGIYMNESAYKNRIAGNYIGLRQDGVTAWGNGSDGMDINIGCQDNIVGGEEPGARNVISGNDGDGIEFSHTRRPEAVTQRLKVINNYIGVSATLGQLKDAKTGAFRKFGNGGEGLTLEDQVFDYEAYGNVIANNGANGIRLYYSVRDVYIHNNYIGLLPDGTPMPNGVSSDPEAVARGKDGIRMLADANNNLIKENIIAYNKGAGIRVDNHVHPYQGGTRSTDNNTFSRNSMFENVGLGIEFVASNNDMPNKGVVAPVISYADTAQVRGTTCAGCTVEIFIATGNMTDSVVVQTKPKTVRMRAGEGTTFIGSGTADATGAFAIPVQGVNVGQSVTATMTDLLVPGDKVNTHGNTSRFAINVTVVAATVTPTPVPPTETPVTPTPVTPEPVPPTTTPVVPTPTVPGNPGGGPGNASRVVLLPLITR